MCADCVMSGRLAEEEVKEEVVEEEVEEVLLSCSNWKLWGW